MAATIENKLKSLANDYYISKDSNEKIKIENSLTNIKSKLKKEFKEDIVDIEVFGSYVRKTNLPRHYDEKSDIDLMVIFNHNNINVNPSTYRKHLHDFVQKYYGNSISYKSQPAVVLELDFIKYDMVPAYKEESWLFSTNTYIPQSNTDWMKTSPHEFSKELDEINEKYEFNVKRIIRLLKAWNAKCGYPIESFELEKEIADFNFSNETLESGFLYAIDELSSSRYSNSAEEKIESLQYNAEKVKDALDDNDATAALKWLGRILPI
ncbi:MAG: hypothetical protein RJA07_3 [Bacteroidota bacterium]|jgi:predicted nucleotidyltransferase